MKKTILSLLVFFTICLLNIDTNAQVTNTTPVIYTYSRPSWVVGFGPAWILATNDAYGRANYSSNDQILRDNYGMRWGIGGYLYGKYSPGKLKNDRIYLGFDYKSMANSDFSAENKTNYDLITIDAGYEYLFYGTYGFRSYYGAGLTGNIISGKYTPKNETVNNVGKSFESTFRMGLELKAGLEFVFKNSKRNLGLNVGARYNLMNLFNDDNKEPLLGETENLNLNDGDSNGGPGFKRYMGTISVDVGLNIYPDVKKIRRK
ncbi:MAG: hypothetical protein IPI04_18805 [Ignavibacteria bacterium]|nr:hypothetical protein [Ignavibacteria bacterium]MBK7255895.1 hypothetical protein [Ignavibacteria bacterium]